jgi:hypothetical protein
MVAAPLSLTPQHISSAAASAKSSHFSALWCRQPFCRLPISGRSRRSSGSRYVSLEAHGCLINWISAQRCKTTSSTCVIRELGRMTEGTLELLLRATRHRGSLSLAALDAASCEIVCGSNMTSSSIEQQQIDRLLLLLLTRSVNNDEWTTSNGRWLVRVITTTITNTVNQRNIERYFIGDLSTAERRSC